MSKITIPVIIITLSLLSTSVQALCGELIDQFPEYECETQIKIGSGSNGTAYLISKDGKKYILKQQVKSAKSVAEAEILRNLRGKQYIVNLVEEKHLPNQLLIIIEYGENGDLDSFFVKHRQMFKDKQFVMQFFGKILKGIQHIHQANYVHTDLKPGNIVVDANFNPIIIDFDLAVVKDQKSTCRGTRGYMAPETVKNFERNMPCTFNGSEDIFAFGAIMFNGVYGTRPFILPKMSFLFMTEIIITYPRGTDMEYYEICSSCIHMPNKRISLEDLAIMFDNSTPKGEVQKLEKSIQFSLSRDISMSEKNKNKLAKSISISSNDIAFMDVLVPIVIILVAFGVALGIVFLVHCMGKRKEEEVDMSDMSSQEHNFTFSA